MDDYIFNKKIVSEISLEKKLPPSPMEILHTHLVPIFNHCNSNLCGKPSLHGLLGEIILIFALICLLSDWHRINLCKLIYRLAGYFSLFTQTNNGSGSSGLIMFEERKIVL